MKYVLYSFLLLLTCACSSSPEAPAGTLPKDEKANVKTSAGKTEPASEAWVGTWKRTEWGENASLDIIKVKADSIYFAMSASSGGNEGGLEGVVVVVNGKAVYFLSDEYDECRIEFILQGDSVLVDQKSGQCQAGNGVYYSGSYKNEKWLAAHPVPDETLLSLGTFQTKEQDDAFRALVGDAAYESFLNSTQLTVQGDDLDGWNAKVTMSGVRGLYTFMENIIMIDKDNHIWAAVIGEESIVYYTNSPKDVATLPKTIEDWRGHVEDYGVVYASKPE